MRVLVLTPDLQGQGGVASYYSALSLDKYPNIDYFSVNRLTTKSLFEKAYYFFFILFQFIFKAVRYRLIHVNPSLNPKSFYRDMIFVFLSKILRKKVLVFFRGWDDRYENSIANIQILSFLFKNTYARADNFIILGPIFKGKLQRLGVDSSKPFHIETTVADSNYLNEFSLKEKIASIDHEVNFLFMSRVVKEKGIYIAIEAFIKCKQTIKNRPMRFYIAGDGQELDNVRNHVRAKSYAGIVFVGYASAELKKKLLLSCHIMILPTYAEGLPNCIMEAMLYGMPVITRAVGGIPDVVEHEINGFLTESVDSEVFARFSTELIRNKSLYIKMANANVTKATSLFTPEKVRARILKIYEKALR